MMPAVMGTTDAGEGKAWDLLAAAAPAAICDRAAVGFDPATNGYRLASFGYGFAVLPGCRRILGLDSGAEAILADDAHFFRLTVLWYLARAGQARPAGNLVRPSALPGGEIFLRGTHVLPLDALARNFGTRPEAFLAAGAGLGGLPAGYGDAAFVLSPLPKVPVTLILWTADDEFPARADLLFDATCTAHLPLDILWSIAMLSIRLLL